ncbi:Tricarboxylate/iron carrier [Phytophthora cactorum]|nr:Tricarboxylate/iron carrier [Phytophthora cactorum]
MIVPMNMIMDGAMLLANSTKTTIFAQWLNQTYNALHYYANRNASNEDTAEQRLVAYVGATASSVGRDGAAAAGDGNEATEMFNQQVDQQKLAAMAARVAQLQDEDAELRARHDKREQETHEFVAYFQKEIQTRDKQLTKLTEELAAARLSHALALEQMQQARDAERQHLIQQAAAKEEAASEQIFYLREELHQLELFREMKDSIATKMKDLERS